MDRYKISIKYYNNSISLNLGTNVLIFSVMGRRPCIDSIWFSVFSLVLSYGLIARMEKAHPVAVTFHQSVGCQD